MNIKLLSVLDNTNAIECVRGGGGNELTLMNF